MDNQAPASPASSTSGSDSDTFNEDSPRVYIGPIKTPERNFVAANKLFPPPVASPLRRSPRLSSPRPQPILQEGQEEQEPESAAQETKDMELVAQLVNEVEVDDDDDDEDNSNPGTPQKGDYVPDEPSSALANKILLAMDNPSPPPSPPAGLSMFDPYHRTSPGILNDYNEDLLSLSTNDRGPLVGDDNPLGPRARLPVSPSRRKADEAGQQVLIALDSPNQSITMDVLQPSGQPTTPGPVLSVDDMFSQSPDIRESPRTTQTTIHTPVLVADEDITIGEDDLMVVDSQQQTAVDLGPQPNHPTTEAQGADAPGERNVLSSKSTEEPVATPLRRSSRPRKSLLPTPSPLPAPPLVFIAPLSAARTSIKKKSALSRRVDEDEIVEDSQDEKEEDGLLSPVRATRTTPRRSRSPSKEPPSFRRELGSLSPESTNLLSTLAFGTASDTTPATGPSTTRSAYEPAPVFSFSVFGPKANSLEPTGAPSTPIRQTPSIDGPRRVPSPTKAEASPTKFRLQAPSSDDTASTPARRIPMEQAIATGQVSPQKAAQLGFKANVVNATPSATVSTPARRVLISEKHPAGPPPSTSKAAASKLASPAKSSAYSQRGRPAEPSNRLAVSVKGKERAVSPSTTVQSSVTTPSNKPARSLPFPIVAAEPTIAMNESSTVATASSNTTGGNISSPSNSSLKQVSSRIPRIHAKPYARTVETKGKKSEVQPREADVAKTDSPLDTTARRSFRMVETSMKPTASSLARTKHPVPASGSSTVTKAAALKRKREEKPPSQVKPRVLRQVPGLSRSTSTKPTSATIATTTPATNGLAKGKKAAVGDTVRIRRVVSPPLKPPSPLVETSEAASEDIAESGETLVATDPSQAKQELIDDPSASSSPPCASHDLPPGSPMKQDAGRHIPPEDDMEAEPTPPVSMIPTPIIVVEPPVPSPPQPEGVSSGLRRTTRQRKTTGASQAPARQSTSSKPVSRRKAAAAYHSDDVFSGMSITALKELTTTNTNKNQQYLTAKLETEVVRKDGLRPESPAVKIRTISQRQQEEKEKEREERANRRARRNLAKGLDGDDAMMSGSEDPGYSSPVEALPSAEDGDVDMEGGEEEDELEEDELPRHVRGAGDEEDYETPERPLKDVKARLFDEGSAQEHRRRVKWDRGLFTLVYLDEVQLGSRQTLKENRDLKGILAPTAKALRLDTLGNLVQVDTPLAELIPENVTVKKFVYDNDVVVVPEPAPPPPKNTRSKGKRKSS